MADLSELDELATMVAVLDAAVRGHRGVVPTAETFSRRQIALDGEDEPAGRARLALPMGPSAPRRAARPGGRWREVVVAEVVQW